MACKYEDIVVDPAQVEACLREHGYVDIPPATLKVFIRDLKKLIKYDLKKGKTTRLQCSRDTAASSSSSTFFSSTETSSRTSCSRTSGDSDKVDGERERHEESSRRVRRHSTGSSEVTTSSESCSVGDNVDGQRDILLEPRRATRRPSFIRPRELAQRDAPPRSDPVALYHYYQSFWDKFKLPGEDARQELRWRIREQMMGAETTRHSNTRSRSAHWKS